MGFLVTVTGLSAPCMEPAALVVVGSSQIESGRSQR